jgi:cyclohexa-1,5-dienecarbonyl-CoA hydratase
MSDMKFVQWQVNDGAGYLTFKRPPVNVINIELLHELASALESAAKEKTLRVLVLRSEGKMFSAGVDVADHTADKVNEMISLFDRVCTSLLDFPTPTLAAVQGHALGGGCELALCCDLIVAVENANFGQPEIKLAVVAPIAALRMPALIGYRRAAELLFTGDNVSAGEAASLGLINRAVPADQFESTVDQFVNKLTSLSAPALQMCKRAVRLGADCWNLKHLPAMEKLYLNDLMLTEDANEGVASFMEKRAAVWKHK